MGTRKRTIRRCSNCKKTGHNKQTCTFVISEKKSGGTPYISVSQKKAASPHIVNLRRELESRVWSDVTAFSEKKVSSSSRRVTVDLAAMVRDANARAPHKKGRKTLRITPPKRKRFSFDLSLPSLSSWKLRRYLRKEEKQSRAKQSAPGILASVRNTYAGLQWKRLAYASVALFLTVAIPFPVVGYYHKVQDTTHHIASASTHGFLALQSSTLAALGSDLPGAEAQLTQALAAFAEAESLLEEEHQVLQYVAGLLPVVGGEVDARKEVLTAGQHLALGNTYLLKGVQATEHDEHMTDKLATLKVHLDRAIPQYEDALTALGSVSPEHVPAEYQQSLIDFRLLFATFIDDMHDMVSLIDALELVFGSDDFRRYLIVFQNNREIRATGGFMGSFAIVDVQKGEIRNINVPAGGTYDVKGQLAVHVAPPLPLQVVNKRWEFQDANWWPDFAASAQKMQWFYEHSRGQTVDGVIALNASVLERFLSIVGPIENSDYGVTLSSEDALDTLQKEVELDYDKEANTPKAIIGDLVEQFLAMGDAFDSAEMLQLLSALHTSAGEKDIQVYMNDRMTQEVFESFGWTGTIYDTEPHQDYLMVVNTNLQGQKSDARMSQRIEHQAVIQEDGSIIDTVMIHRKHEGQAGELFYGGPNINYMRVYVPEGAELLEAGGFAYPPEEAFKAPDVWSEADADVAQHEMNESYHDDTGTRIIDSFGKTVFENWVATAPGEESTVYFVYKLPFTVQERSQVQTAAASGWAGKLIGAEEKKVSTYTLVAQRQSGVESEFATAIIYPDGWRPVWRSDDRVNLAMNGAHMTDTLRYDMSIGVIMEQQGIQQE